MSWSIVDDDDPPPPPPQLLLLLLLLFDDDEQELELELEDRITCTDRPDGAISFVINE